jgi:predicted glycogen debranching enzyme
VTHAARSAPGATDDVARIGIDTENEWLEADGLGGFSSGTSSGLRTRRYHALLLVAARPPADRWVLVSGFDAWLDTAEGREQLTEQHYAPSVTTRANARIERFEAWPWPEWRYVTESGLVVRQELTVLRDRPLVLLTFRLETPRAGVQLSLRPFLGGRELHHLHHENQRFGFEPERDDARLTFRPYPGVPAIVSWSNGDYRHAPEWYRNFRYVEEQRRGLDCDEDLAAPGVITFDLSKEEASWLLTAETPGAPELDSASLAELSRTLKPSERARRARQSPLECAAEAYLVKRGGGRSIIAGYPWFSDWGRDTFIAVRGLCLATGRLGEARDILVAWSDFVSEGMLPNRFPERSGEPPEYNSVDASLWYVVVARELLDHSDAGSVLANRDRARLLAAMRAIVAGYARGTRFGIRCDDDGLLYAGAPGSQLTWMDAKVGDHVVTPRAGKPVEIQALWLNALHAVRELENNFELVLERGRRHFEARFWNESAQALYDVVDVAGEPGCLDASLRPNQIFAAGGLPVTLLSPERTRRVVECVERRLWTPLGLRSLDPDHPDFKPRYEGGVWERDTAYHQGTVWPWLSGAFVEAWLKARGNTADARRVARERFLEPLSLHLTRCGLGHVSEIADATPPHTPRGCPFQAWSVSELLRLEVLLGTPGGGKRHQL